MPYDRDPTPRDEHLKRCPERSCARARRCLALAMGGECIKTHFHNSDEIAGYMADKINAYHAQLIADDPETEFIHGDEALAKWKRAFEGRVAEFEANGELYDLKRILTQPRPGEVGYIAPKSSARA